MSRVLGQTERLRSNCRILASCAVTQTLDWRQRRGVRGEGFFSESF